jgi:4-hydroxybenzoate polyprenyltransferase
VVIALVSGLVALVGVLLARGAWAAQETIRWQDILWWVSLVALFRLGYAIACASEDEDPEREQGIVVVLLRVPASVFSVLLIVVPLGAAHLVTSFQGTPLEPLALVRLAMLGVAVWLAGLVGGAPKRLPPASLACHIVRCVTKTRVHIAPQHSLP